MVRARLFLGAKATRDLLFLLPLLFPFRPIRAVITRSVTTWDLLLLCLRVPHPFTLSLEGLALPALRGARRIEGLALSLEGRIEGSLGRVVFKGGSLPLPGAATFGCAPSAQAVITTSAARRDLQFAFRWPRQRFDPNFSVQTSATGLPERGNIDI
jgi:hypothetical protein